VAVTTFSAGTTGFTPSTATSGAVTLAGTLATTNGGTGLTSFTANGVVYASSTSALATGSALTFNGTNLFTVIPATGTAYNRTESTQYSTWLQTGAGNANVFWEFSAGTPVRWVDTSAGELMRLTSTGLGIGTSSPSTKLTVHAGADGDVGFFRGGSTRQVQIGTSSTAGYINTDNGSAGLEIRTQGTARMFVDNSGNLGLGVTPSAWGSGYKALQINNGSLATNNSGNFTGLTANAYFDGTNYKYVSTGAASLYRQNAGAHDWNIAPSWNGTGSDIISFTQAMTLDASSRLLLGTTNAGSNQGMTIYNATQGELRLQNSTTGNTAADGFQVMVNGSDAYVFNRENAPLLFGTNDTERARITSGGNLLVGTTSDTPAQSNVSGFKVGGGQIECNGTDTQAAFFGRSNDGQVIRFYNAGAAAGNISNTGTTTSYNGTSDYRLKENIQPMVGALEKVAALKPCTYTWKVDGRLGQGFIAHELQEVIPDAVQGTKDEVDENGNPEYQGIDPRMIVATLTAAIQELKAQNDDLRARVAQLEAK
jgi:hypothetical protein